MHISIDIEKLRIFYEVCSTLSFSKASKSLNITQGSVSRNISTLEKSLGFSLFARTTRTMSLTAEGERVLEYAEGIFDNIKQLENFLSVKDEEPSGRLRVYGGENSLASLLLGDLARFKETYPSIIFDIIGSNDVPKFSKHLLNVGIFGEIHDQAEIVQDYLMTFELGIYASKSYLKKFGTPKKIEDLDHHQVIVFGNHDVPFSFNENWLLTAGVPHGTERKPYLMINTAPLTCYAGMENLGIILLQKDSYILKSSGLVEILPELEKPKFKIYYTYHELHRNHPSVVAVEKYLRGVISKKGWA